MLLSDGKPHYFGPVHAVMDYYESVGHVIPLHINPAEFVLEMVNIDFASDRALAQTSVDELQRAWAVSPAAKALSGALSLIEEKASGPIELDAAEKKPSPPSLVLTLLHRSFIKSYRDVVAYGIRYAMFIGGFFVSGPAAVGIPS